MKYYKVLNKDIFEEVKLQSKFVYDGEYTYYNARAEIEIAHENGTKSSIEMQTGHTHRFNDLNCPSNDFSVYYTDTKFDDSVSDEEKEKIEDFLEKEITLKSLFDIDV